MSSLVSKFIKEGDSLYEHNFFNKKIPTNSLIIYNGTYPHANIPNKRIDLLYVTYIYGIKEYLINNDIALFSLEAEYRSEINCLTSIGLDIAKNFEFPIKHILKPNVEVKEIENNRMIVNFIVPISLLKK